jgi:hypothetical protein
MERNKRYLALFFLILAVMGILFLSSGLPGIALGSQWRGSSFGLAEEENDGEITDVDISDRLPEIPSSVLQIMLVSTVILVPATLFFSLFSQAGRQAMLDAFKRIVSLIIWMVAILYFVRRLRIERTLSRASNVATGINAPPDWITNPTALTAFVVGVILLALLGSIGWFMWRRRKGRKVGLIAREAQLSLDRLQAGHDIRNVIIECYYRMCQVLSEQRRIERAKSMTPREFASRLELAGVGGIEAQRLTRLFEAVRYGAQSYGPIEEREAIECLTAVSSTVQKP